MNNQIVHVISDSILEKLSVRIAKFSSILMGNMTKVSSIVLFSYFIMKAQYYTVSWNLLRWIVPDNRLTSVDELFSAIGTYVLVIPLTIMITSLFYNESRVINTLSRLFSSLGIVLIVIKYFQHTGNPFEFVNCKAFIIYNEYDYSEKVKQAELFYNQILSDAHIIDIDKREFLKAFFSERKADIMEVIKQTQTNKIESYIKAVYDTADTAYETAKEKKQVASFVTTFLSNNATTLLKIGGVILGIGFVYWAGSSFIGGLAASTQAPDLIVKNVELHQGLAKLTGELALQSKATVSLVEQLNTTLKTAITDGDTQVLDILGKSVATLYELIKKNVPIIT